MMQISFTILAVMTAPVKLAKEANFMNIFRRPHYESEITQFLEKLKTDKPTMEAGQLAERELL